MPPIVELLKCIYGLPQAAKYFDEHVTERLLAMGFKRCISDTQLFVITKDGETLYLLKHVDDFICGATKGSSLLAFVAAELGKSYTLTSHKEPTNFVGLAI